MKKSELKQLIKECLQELSRIIPGKKYSVWSKEFKRYVSFENGKIVWKTEPIPMTYEQAKKSKAEYDDMMIFPNPDADKESEIVEI